MEHNLAIVHEVSVVAAAKGATPAQIALSWFLAQQPRIVPIPCTTKLHRLEENLGAAEVSLTQHEFARLTEASSSIEVHGGRYPDALEAQTKPMTSAMSSAVTSTWL